MNKQYYFFLAALLFSLESFTQNQIEIKTENKIESGSLDQAFNELNKNQIDELKKDPKKIELLKKKIEEYQQKQIPLMIPSFFKEVLTINIPICDSKLFRENLEKCSYYTCLEEQNVMGMMKINSQKIIHGFNKQGNCAFSMPTVRYYVPKVHLLDFSKLMFAKTGITGSFSAGAETQKYQEELTIDGLNCVIDVELKHTYSKTIAFEIESTKVVSYKTSAKSPKECKNMNITLLYELKKQGLTEDIKEDPITID